MDCLPFDIESLVVKIYKHFHIYTVRVTKLKEFCDWVDVEYKKVMQHGSTRFLSLLPAIERILQIFDGLKSYFLSEENCPTAIKKFFEADEGEMYFWFVHGQLSLFNKVTLQMEKTRISATEVSLEMNSFKTNLQERLEKQFIPQGAKNILAKIEKENPAAINRFRGEVTTFYKNSISYIELWENSLEGTEKFSWVRLTDEIDWNEIESSAEYINNKLKGSSCCCKIDIDELFDEVLLANRFFKTKREEWQASGVFSSEERWVQLFKHFNEKQIDLQNLTKIVEFVLCLPGTSAPVERVFSMMKNIWSDERGRMDEATVRALLYCKLNYNKISCSQFFDTIKDNEAILKKVCSSEKYNKLEV